MVGRWVGERDGGGGALTLASTMADVTRGVRKPIAFPAVLMMPMRLPV